MSIKKKDARPLQTSTVNLKNVRYIRCTYPPGKTDGPRELTIVHKDCKTDMIAGGLFLPETVIDRQMIKDKEKGKVIAGGFDK